jgi:glycosyltransferase involved in cell wall biosynthesis
VLVQTDPDFELVIVDNGSTDDTPSLERTFRDERVRWMRVETRGVGAARNAGIAAARGEWVAFLDDDDEWSPTFLERQLATAARTGASVVYCAAVEEMRDGRREVHEPLAHARPGLDVMVRGWHPFVGCVIVRRAALVAAGGFATDLPIREDWHLLLRLALRERFAATPERLMVRHHHGGERLGADHDASLVADRAIDRELGPAIRSHAGWGAYARWYRWHCGEDEIQRMWRTAPEQGRRAALTAVGALARRLPWSAPSLARPAVVAIVGPDAYQRLQRARRAPE